MNQVGYGDTAIELETCIESGGWHEDGSAIRSDTERSWVLKKS